MFLNALNDNPKLQFLSLSSACWLISFVFSLMPLATYEAESFLLSAVFLFFAFAASLVVAPREGLKRLRNSAVFIGVMAFWALALLSVLLSEVAAVSFIYFVFFSALPLSFVLFSLHSRGELLAACLVGAGFVLCALALFALISYLALPEFLIYGQVHWPLSNPNSFAGLMSYGFWGALGVCVYSKAVSYKALAAFHMFLFFAAMLMTGSVGALLAVALVVPVFVIMMRRVLKVQKRLLAGLFVGCALLSTVFTMPIGQIRSHANSEAGVSVEILSSRPALWQSALEIFKAHPLHGTGIGTFFLYYPEARNPEDPNTAGLMAHNDPLQFAAEMGVLAPILFYLLAVLILIKTCRAMVGKGLGERQKLVVFTCFCALGSMILHTHVTFHLNVLSMLMLTGMVLAMWRNVGCTSFEGEGAPMLSYQCIVGKFAILSPIIIVLAFFIQLQVSQIFVNKAQSAVAEGDVQTAINYVNRADELSFGTNSRAYISAANIHLGILQLNAPLMPKDELAKMVTDVRALLGKAQMHNPRSAAVLHAQGELRLYTEPFLRAEDRVAGKRAHELFGDALKLDPLFLSSRLKLVDRALRSKDLDQAVVLLEEGLQWRYKAQNPAFFLEKAGIVAKTAGRQDVYGEAKRQWAIYFKEPYPVQGD